MGNDHRLSVRETAVLAAMTLAVLVAGAALYAAGLNESFYAGGETLRGAFEVLTQLGNQTLYLVVLSLVYLSYDKRFGRRLCLLFFFMVWATDFLKEMFHDPRPPANLDREEPYTSYGLPSGHTTTSVSFYGYILLSHLDGARRRLPLLLVCGFIVVVVPISRLVIGVHDVQDVAGGAVAALSVMTAYMVLLPRVRPVVMAWPVWGQAVIGACSALLLWLVGSVVLAWHHPGSVLVAFQETAMGAGLLLGCALAFPLEEAYVGYRPDLLAPGRRVLAAVIGLPVTVAVYVGMSVASGSLLPEHVEDVLTYSVLIFVLTFLVPLLLRRLLGERTGDDAGDPGDPGDPGE